MDLQNPYEYLQWEYERLASKDKVINSMSLDDYFDKAKDIYGEEQKDLYESDRILFKQLEKIASTQDLPIDEQDKDTYWILNRHSKNIIEVLKDNNLKAPDVVLGTLPINDLNAFVCNFPNGQMLIALNKGLIQFFYFMGRIVSSFFQNKEENLCEKTMTFDFNIEQIIENLNNNRKGHDRFIEALVLYFAYSDLSLSKIYFEKDENLHLSHLLWDNAQLFVVAHEYSHVILDHLSPNNKFIKRLLDDESMLYEVQRNWSEELAADKLALQIVLAYNQKIEKGTFAAYLGVELLFVSLDIIEKACNIEFSETHPSSNIRIENLRKSIIELLPEKSQTILDGSKVIEIIGMNLWNTNRERIYDLCNKI